MSEHDLIARAKQRDVYAWADWYEEHYVHLYRYAYRKTRTHEDAEDIASQTFVEAFKAIDNYQDRGGPILAWLYGIARNLIAQQIRREKRARARLTLLSPVAEESQSDQVSERVDLLSAMRLLTPEQQDVIVLRFFLGRSTREVPAILDKRRMPCSRCSFVLSML